jgi:hypothetical protein
MLKNYMPRLKGQKNAPPVIPTEEYQKEFIRARASSVEKSPVRIAKNVADKNYQYLSSIFEAMVENYEKMELPETLESAPKCMNRYTPKQMFDNSVAYMRATIKAKQPLTITGLGLFMGIRRADFFDMLHERKAIKDNPFMAFIYDFASFIEMYDEYAAHQKQNPAGPIFILKNFGWKDKFEIEASSPQGALTPEERDAARARMAAFTEEIPNFNRKELNESNL